jgi:hypothetical protein
MNYYDVLYQYIKSGVPLTEHQFNKIKINNHMIKSYFKGRSNVIDQASLDIKSDFTFGDYEINFLNNNINYLSLINGYSVFMLTITSGDPRKIIKIKGLKDFKNALDQHIGDFVNSGFDLEDLVYVSPNPDALITVIADAMSNDLNENLINKLLMISENPENVVKYIYKLKDKDLTEKEIEILKYWTSDFDF